MHDPNIVYYTSPWMPCGSFWVVNCLLEMGIKVSTYRRAHDDWTFDGKYHYPNAFTRFSSLTPAFSDNTRFEFRDDVHVIWGHVFPYAHLYRHKVIMLTRDPRDALHHQHAREAKMRDITYMDWLRWPFHETLLDMVDTWALYHQLWMQHPNLGVFRYEDKCRNSKRTMQRILEFIGVEVEERSLERALWMSSYQRYCENNNRPYDPKKRRFDQWRSREGEEMEQMTIEQVAGDVMRQFQYNPVHGQDVDPLDPYPMIALNPFFHDIPYHGAQTAVNLEKHPYLLKILAFMRFIEENPHCLPDQTRTRLTWGELIDNFEGFQRNAMSVGLFPRPHIIPQELRP